MEETQLNLGALGSFDFTPDWARKDAGVTVAPSREEKASDAKASTRVDGNKQRSGEARKPFVKKSFAGKDRAPRSFERVKPLEADIKVLPETKALGTIIRKIQQDTHAYKLKDLAYFFLNNPASVLLKVQPKDGTVFHQCKACGFATTSADALVEHILSEHLSDYYEKKEVECEMPKGNFTCVAKCGLSGVLLGPPNVHEFNTVVKEMIRTRYPNMTEADYRSHIEMVRDSEEIEKWRNSAVTKRIYLAKGSGEDAMPLTLEQAEAEFKRTVLRSLLDSPKQLMITAEAVAKSPIKSLQLAVKRSLEIERRAPYNMCFALRGAFHHRKLHFFRANDARGSEFVSSIEYKEFDATHAIPELAKIATFIAENPCQTKAVIAPDAESDKQLTWLVSTGHVVAFTNGVYSAVEKFPKYGPQWQKKSDKDASVEASENTATGRDASPLASENTATGRDASPLASENENLKEEKSNESSSQLAE